MNYEFQIEAETVEQLQESLTAIVVALKMVSAPGTIRFARYPAANDYAPNLGQGAAAQRLDEEPTVPIETIAEAASSVVPIRRRRRRSNGSGTDDTEQLAEPSVVQNPDGGLAAVTQPMEIPGAPAAAPEPEQPEQPEQPGQEQDPAELPAGLKPPPEDTGADMAPEAMRERALSLMQQAFGYAQGPDLVRAVHRRLKVRKISDVPEDKCRELLDDATNILAQLRATSQPLDLLAMAGKK